MLYNLDLTLLEVFFVYSLKKAKTDIFSMSAHLPSLQLVTELPDSTKGGAKGHVMVRGMGGVEASARPFSPNYSLVIPGPERRGHLVDWVEKASFACLKERTKEPFGRLPDRNARAASPQIKLQRKEEAGEEWEGSEGAHSSQGICSSANYSRGGVPPWQRLPAANLAEEAASINHPDSPNPDVDAAEAVCATPMEEGAESQSQPSDDPDRLALVLVKGPPSKRPRSARNLRSGLIGRLQDRQQEIEVSCSSAYDAHRRGRSRDGN
ncbi:hypothetical protein CK203_011818 [Vitis vinifera]|uniref:Uncharacterized protein n=1 Tax=Vitis vinifera TaxID=29760 RepID=A0A438JU73_VITVI|nr:hypothetical protein CK203_011818 [Vitis vinifera]